VLRQERQRLVRALEYLAEQDLLELQVAGVRQRFTRLVECPDVAGLVAELTERFRRREQQEVARVQHVIDLIQHAGCQTYALLRYFGEEHGGHCGHCSFCQTGQPAAFPPPAPRPPLAAVCPADAFSALCATAPAALGHARQRARFLCGLTSPGLSRHKLARHPLCGVLEGYRFLDVLRWCEEYVRP